MSVGDLVADEHGEKGLITCIKNYRNNGYVEVTFFCGLYGLLKGNIYHTFLTRLSEVT